jgi:hypothetical protein
MSVVSGRGTGGRLPGRLGVIQVGERLVVCWGQLESTAVVVEVYRDGCEVGLVHEAALGGTAGCWPGVITDHNGLLKDRNRTFASKDEFFAWAKKKLASSGDSSTIVECVRLFAA